MSGGSLNYLYCKDPEALFNHIEDLEHVEWQLLRRGHKDVALDVRRLIEYLQTAYNRISVLSDQLKGVCKAVEWYLSSDSSIESVDKAVVEYRNK